MRTRLASWRWGWRWNGDRAAAQGKSDRLRIDGDHVDPASQLRDRLFDYLCGISDGGSAGPADALHRIGARILSQPALFRQLASWYELPVVPWTALNNTVVLGATVLGAVLFYPTFHLSEKVFRVWIDRRNRISALSTPNEASPE